MSVTGRGGKAGYSDLEHQHEYVEIRTTADYDGTNTGEDDLTIPQLTVIEPLGGLGRDELAELVAVVHETLITSRTSNAGTVPADTHAYFEVSLDPTIQASRYDPEGNIQYTDEFQLDGDGDGTDDTFIRTGPSLVDPDIMWTAEAQHFPASEDAPSGSGWGGFTTYDKTTLDFQDLLGGGPVLDRHNEVYFHGSLGGHGSAIQAAQHRVRMYWNVFQG